MDADVFSRLVVRDVLLGSARETLAEAIHERYRLDNADKRAADDPAMAAWNILDEGLKESNRRQADHIPTKLKAVGCDFAPASRGSRSRPVLSGGDRDHGPDGARPLGGRKASPGIQPRPQGREPKDQPVSRSVGRPDEEIKDYDRKAVREIPELLAAAGFEIYRLKTR